MSPVTCWIYATKDLDGPEGKDCLNQGEACKVAGERRYVLDVGVQWEADMQTHQHLRRLTLVVTVATLCPITPQLPVFGNLFFFSSICFSSGF